MRLTSEPLMPVGGGQTRGEERRATSVGLDPGCDPLPAASPCSLSRVMCQQELKDPLSPGEEQLNSGQVSQRPCCVNKAVP